jgi:hypothetical protein
LGTIENVLIIVVRTTFAKPLVIQPWFAATDDNIIGFFAAFAHADHPWMGWYSFDMAYPPNFMSKVGIAKPKQAYPVWLSSARQILSVDTGGEKKIAAQLGRRSLNQGLSGDQWQVDLHPRLEGTNVDAPVHHAREAWSALIVRRRRGKGGITGVTRWTVI